ncbi:FK506-binding protein 2 [Eurytemora carolleeae]|uniref:FK506-binding protein 2 n=1 Tax=Eurytemora carolleeae TaxID=1294199 RepID=UPI000C76B23E|nr:FK506-binding protein 2 [Eurytemora carolleeae]|eukprot:XP_023335042.1 FK506-binding protein 2-like [Eurytemora affinis]
MELTEVLQEFLTNAVLELLTRMKTSFDMLLLLISLSGFAVLNAEIVKNDINENDNEDDNWSNSEDDNLDQPPTLEEGEELVLGSGLKIKCVKLPRKCLRQARPGDVLEVHYEGRFDDDKGKMFETSKGSIPFRFNLGSNQVIQGYEQGVPGMCKGEVRELFVPSELGYGQRQAGKIPPNSALHFTVELLSIQVVTSCSTFYCRTAVNSARN